MQKLLQEQENAFKTAKKISYFPKKITRRVSKNIAYLKNLNDNACVLLNAAVAQLPVAAL